MRKVFFKNLTSELTEIKMDQSGLSLQEPFGAKSKNINWKSISDIYFAENYTEIIIENSERQILIKNNFIGWYEFIQNVPQEFVNFDFNYVSHLMDSLQPCKICGLISVKENQCLVCEITPWNDKNPKSKTEYIKQKQLVFFADWIKEGRQVQHHNGPEYGFKADKNWKSYI